MSIAPDPSFADLAAIVGDVNAEARHADQAVRSMTTDDLICHAFDDDLLGVRACLFLLSRTDQYPQDCSQTPPCASCEWAHDHCRHCVCRRCATHNAARLYHRRYTTTTYPESVGAQWWATVEQMQGTGEPHPLMLATDCGRPVVYADATVWLAGEAKSGKSWVALMCAAHANRALYIDHENTPTKYHERMTLLGYQRIAEDTDRVRWVRGGRLWHDYGDGEKAERTDLEDALAWITPTYDGEHTLVIIDTAEADGCPSDGAEVQTWIRDRIHPWRNVGAGVLIVDHLPKNRKERARGPIGSGRKTAEPDLILQVNTPHCWTRANDGTVTLTNGGDRHGYIDAPEGAPIATIRGAWRDGAFSYTIQPADTTTTSTTPDRRTERLANTERRILKALGDGEIVGYRNLRQATGTNQNITRDAVDALIVRGLVKLEDTGRAHTFRLATETETQ